MITLFIKKLSESLKQSNKYNTLINKFIEAKFPIDVEGTKSFFTAFTITSLINYSKGSFLIIAPDETEAKNIFNDISIIHEKTLFLEDFRTFPYSDNRVQESIYGKRIHILSRMLKEKKLIIVTYLKAFLSPQISPDFLADKILRIADGQNIDLGKLENKINEFGYLRVPRVSVLGEFAIRGEVLDIFIPGEDYPVRIVYDFDTVDEIKYFDPVNQNSVEKINEIEITPLKEVIWTDERIDCFLSKYPLNNELKEELEEKRHINSEEYFFPLSFDNKYSLVDFLVEKSTVFFINPELSSRNSDVLKKEYTELYKRASKNLKNIPSFDDVLFDFETLRNSIKRRMNFPFIRDHKNNNAVSFHCDAPRSFFGNINYLKEELENFSRINYSVFIFSESDIQANRLKELLKDYEINVISEKISSGFSLPDDKIIAIHETEIFGRKRNIPASVKKTKSKAIDSFVELNQGDYVVHINYGIGKFKGIERIKAAGTERDYIELLYADDETIFIPIEQVNLVQRYIGQEGSAPRLDKIGGKSWETRKNRVRQSVEDIADLLIDIYAARKNATGYAFPEDTEWQMEFEASFPYEETEDQLKCIEEVKEDMEMPRPMDRLVCGDVGYGKTEIAMRAAFKSVTGGRQVAYLAPTTILAEQHYENFLERFSNFPVKIKMISRFVPKSQQTKIIEQLLNGEIDILIGTHRILQKDIVFKNLGLFIVDEEQRFGVKDKEKLKKYKNTIDCLSLSATPIPRTLHMSLLKIRDLSILKTPPSNRRPIKTFINPFNEEIIKKAIEAEIARGGQIFFLHNRIETLENMQLFIEKLVPEVYVQTAHGRMSANKLEEVMHSFIHGSFQVLVSTTIIENGIDIPNVNTIIIDRADNYGISQLYQLRGRVGRSDREAFAYLLYPEEKALSEIAMKRLNIISDNTELGSGFTIALKDMEVRGTGNLLGREQHGEIASVGFDMYLRLLDEAIQEKSNDPESEKQHEVYLELDYSGYIPDTYIREAMEKMEIYKKIVSINTDNELNSIYSELNDRYGPMPDEVSSLLSLAEIKIICSKLKISSLKERSGNAKIEFARVSEISVDKVLKLIKEGGGKIKLDPLRPNIIIMETGKIGLKEKSEFIREKLSALL